MPKVDLAKRRRIMQRSMALGHCICDPKRPCPCDVFRDQGICPCAGERPDPAPAGSVRLTELVHNAGCASKIAPGDLEAVLARLPAVEDPHVLCGLAAGDDAGVYDLNGQTLVQTVDVFTPCVDDPYTFGRICAANCLSDIYAMGGTPRTALSILGFPAETLDGQIMYEMLRGAMDALAEANVALIGGHSIKDDEIKLGFAITGTVAKSAIERGAAKAGDRLVLTKPLGTGVLNFARQIGRGHPEGLAAAERSMAMLNALAAEAMREAGASACTDVTGFGLLGHLAGMVRHSGVTVRLWAEALPAFPGALEALADGVVPGAIERNREYVADDLDVGEGVDESAVHLAFDAQTSGGLLIAVSADRCDALLTALAARGVEAWAVGKVTGESDGRIELVAGEATQGGNGQAQMAGTAAAPATKAQPSSDCCCGDTSEASAQPAQSSGCCGGDGSGGFCGGSSESDASAETGTGTSAESLRAFGALMRSSGADGAIDAKTKELINFALVLLARCDPCLEVHIAKAQKMGLTQVQLDEAAWCAIAMGGAPVKMFYEAGLKNAAAPAKGCC